MITTEGKWVIGLILGGFSFLGTNIIGNDRLRANENIRIEAEFNNKNEMIWKMIDENYKQQMVQYSEIIQRLARIEGDKVDKKSRQW